MPLRAAVVVAVVCLAACDVLSPGPDAAINGCGDCDAAWEVCDMPPFETTCRFGATEPAGSTEWSSPDARCTDSLICDFNEWQCPPGGELEGARVCLEACRLYAEANPACACIADTFGYEVRIEC